MGETRQRKHDSKSGPEKDKAKDKDHTEKNGKKQQGDETKKGKKVNLLAYRYECVIENNFTYFLTKPYVLGTQPKMRSFEPPNHVFGTQIICLDKEISQFYSQYFCLSCLGMKLKR